jgi:hypothetical protein
MSPNQIEISESGERAIIRVGPQEARCSLKSRARGARFAGYLCISFPAVMSSGTVWLAWRDARKIIHFFPVPHHHLALWVLVVSVLSAGELILLLIVAGLSCMAMVYVCPRHVRWLIDASELVEVHRQGLYRRTRRIRRKRIAAILVHPPRDTTWVRAHGPPEQREGMLRLIDHEGNYINTRGQYAHAVAIALAGELAAQLGPAANVAVLDAMNPAFLNDDEAACPRGYLLRIDNIPAGREIAEETSWPTLRAILNDGRFWVLAVVASLLLILLSVGGLLTIFRVHNSLAKDVWSMSRQSLVVFFSFLALVLLHRRKPALFRITLEAFEVLSRKPGSLRWRRDEIEGLEVSHYVSLTGRNSTGIAVKPSRGVRPFVVEGDVLQMRYLAAVLRQALGISWTATDSARSQQELAWRQVDERSKPPTSRWIVESRPNETVMRRPPAYTPAGILGLCVYGLFAFVGLIGLVCWVFSSDPGVRRALMGLAIILGGFGLLGIAAITLEATLVYEFQIRPDLLRRVRKSLFGVRVLQWDRSNLRAVGTRPGNGPISECFLKLAIASRPDKTILSGGATEMRYLATVFRDTLHLPALGRDPIWDADVKVTRMRQSGLNLKN